MGRKLPSAGDGASTETVAGRKRKGASLAPLARGKRRARASSDGWASLTTDIVVLVVRRVVATGSGGDIVDYIAFRAVCFGWRACTPALRDPTLRDPRLRPRSWVALCDGDAVRPDAACEIAFFHKRTARRIRVHLPELRRYRIVGFTDGLVILLHKRSTLVRVLNPFTRVAVDFPPLAAVYREEIGLKQHLLQMNAVVCGSASSADTIAVVVWFPWTPEVLAADPNWNVLRREGRSVWSMLPFQEKLYATFLASRKIAQIYPPPPNGSPTVVARVPDIFGDIAYCEFFLVECAGLMLLAAQYPSSRPRNEDWSRQVSFRLYAVRLPSSSGGGIAKLIPARNLGDFALFLSLDRCLSVSARGLPSVRSNSIYFSLSDSPAAMHSLETGLSEQLSEHCQIHDMVDRIRPFVRPFTIVDHLLAYCHPREWAEGLMFHEYHHIPRSFDELRKTIRRKNAQLRIPIIKGQ